MTVLAHPLDAISKEACPYPADMLTVGGTGLCLFAAGFLGTNDAIHMARKDMTVTCVDTNTVRMAEMEALYPPSWSFVVGDAWNFTSAAASRGTRWDEVSVDTWTGDLTDQSMDTLDLWCSVANHAVTATITKGRAARTPNGWRSSRFPRSPIADWLVMRRD